MLEEQKKLLTQIQVAEASALRLYNKGVKIMNVVTTLREAAGEVAGRIKFIEREEKAQRTKPAIKEAEATGRESGDSSHP